MATGRPGLLRRRPAPPPPKPPTPTHLNAPTPHLPPPTQVSLKDALKSISYGSKATSDARVLMRLLGPANADMCQLTVGITFVAPGSVWNQNPAHLHERRSEVRVCAGGEGRPRREGGKVLASSACGGPRAARRTRHGRRSRGAAAGERAPCSRLALPALHMHGRSMRRGCQRRPPPGCL